MESTCNTASDVTLMMITSVYSVRSVCDGFMTLLNCVLDVSQSCTQVLQE